MDASLPQSKLSQNHLYLDPRTKTLLCIVTSTIMLSGDGQGMLKFIEPCLALVPIIFFLALKKYKTAGKYSAVYLFAAVVPKLLLPYVTGFFYSFIIIIVASLTKLLPGFLMGYLIIATTTVSEFIAAMERMYMPKQITISMSVMFRFFPTIKAEYGFIKDAMKIRGICGTRNPLTMIEYRLVPLLMSVVMIGNDLSASALTRGLGAPVKRTNICNIGFRWFDYIVFAFIFFCCVGFVI